MKSLRRALFTLWDWTIIAAFTILICLVWLCNRGKRGLWDDEGEDYEVKEKLDNPSHP